jgi:hypothetical protein
VPVRASAWQESTDQLDDGTPTTVGGDTIAHLEPAEVDVRVSTARASADTRWNVAASTGLQPWVSERVVDPRLGATIGNRRGVMVDGVGISLTTGAEVDTSASGVGVVRRSARFIGQPLTHPWWTDAEAAQTGLTLMHRYVLFEVTGTLRSKPKGHGEWREVAVRRSWVATTVEIRALRTVLAAAVPAAAATVAVLPETDAGATDPMIDQPVAARSPQSPTEVMRDWVTAGDWAASQEFYLAHREVLSSMPEVRTELLRIVAPVDGDEGLLHAGSAAFATHLAIAGLPLLRPSALAGTATGPALRELLTEPLAGVDAMLETVAYRYLTEADGSRRLSTLLQPLDAVLRAIRLAGDFEARHPGSGEVLPVGEVVGRTGWLVQLLAHLAATHATSATSGATERANLAVLRAVALLVVTDGTQTTGLDERASTIVTWHRGKIGQQHKADWVERLDVLAAAAPSSAASLNVLSAAILNC